MNNTKTIDELIHENSTCIKCKSNRHILIDTDQLLSTIKAGLPEKQEPSTKVGEIIPFDGKKRVDMDYLPKVQKAGWNNALTQVEEALDKMFGHDIADDISLEARRKLKAYAEKATHKKDNL